MFYYGYSNYMPEQIINDRYNQMAEKILELASTDDLKQKLYDLLYKGGFNKFSINLSEEEYIPRHKDSPFHEGIRRIDYAYFFANNPEMLEMMEKNNSILLHGTKIDALPSILKYGMNSVSESLKNGIEVSTGEEWSRIDGKRDFISLTNSLETALGYSALENKAGYSSFGVILGIDPKSLKELNTMSIRSDLSEVGIKDHLPLEYIKTITVPKEKVDFVKRMVGDRTIDVVGADIGDIFYSMNNSEKMLYLEDPESFKVSKTIEYGKEDMQNLAKTGLLDRIKNFFSLFANKENDSRTVQQKNSYGLEER